MKTYKFKARIEGAFVGGACVFFPYNVEEEFGTKGAFPSKPHSTECPYTGSLVKYGAAAAHAGHSQGVFASKSAKVRATPSK